jgi:hypothetical protein
MRIRYLDELHSGTLAEVDAVMSDPWDEEYLGICMKCGGDKFFLRSVWDDPYPEQCTFFCVECRGMVIKFEKRGWTP